MKQDKGAIQTDAPHFLSPSQSTSLYGRVVKAMRTTSVLRDNLLAIGSTSTKDGEPAPNVSPDDLQDSWTQLEAAVTKLESAAETVRTKGLALSEMFMLDGAANKNERDHVESRASQDLEKLIVAQRETLAGLNKQLATAESTLRSSATTAGKPRRNVGDVEIQDISEFLQHSSIASIPVNASYYQRILEASRAPEGHKKPMGAILIEAGLITERQLENSLRHQKDGPKRPLGMLLVDLGYTNDSAIAQTLAAQLALPFISLSQETVRKEALDELPLHLARRHACFPISVDDGALQVAMANPLDLIALEDLRLASGKHVRPCVASREEITAHINRHYSGSTF